LTKTIRAAKVSNTIVTPRLNLWLQQHHNVDLDAEIADLIRDLLVKPQRDRTKSFSSSSSGKCPRRQIYEFIGVPTGSVFSPQTISIFHDGTWRHLRWQAALLQAGILSEVEVMLDWPRKRSMGSMDGQGIVPEDHKHEPWRGLQFGFELKGANSFAYKSFAYTPSEDHLDQIHRYFLSGGLDLFVLIYENKDTNEFKEYVIEPDPERLAKQQRELDMLNRFVDRQRIPPMLKPCQEQKGAPWTTCPFGGKDGVCIRRNQWQGK
jgi:hypothetical protein